MYKKYRNLVKDHIPTRPEQLWVSDITYIKTQNGHNYLALVTDAYSKQVMGYKLDGHMRGHRSAKMRLPWPLKTGNTPTKGLYTIPIGVSNTVTPNTRTLPRTMELQ